MSIDVITGMFNLSIMQANMIISAIPIQWKHTLKSGMCNVKNELMLYDRILNIRKAASFCNRTINNNENLLFEMYNKWKVRFPTIQIEFDDYLESYYHIFTNSNQSKVRSFQYRMLMSALVFNDKLFRWGNRSSNKCAFCDVDKETEFHFYWECPVADITWKWFRDFCLRKFKVSQEKIKISSANTALSNVSQYSAINFCCIITKMYMYNKRCSKQHIICSEIEKKIDHIRLNELYYAKMTGKLTQHIKKWTIGDNNDVFTINNNSGLDDDFILMYSNQQNVISHCRNISLTSFTFYQ